MAANFIEVVVGGHFTLAGDGAARRIARVAHGRRQARLLGECRTSGQHPGAKRHGLAPVEYQRFGRDLGLGQGKAAEFQDMHGGRRLLNPIKAR